MRFLSRRYGLEKITYRGITRKILPCGSSCNSELDALAELRTVAVQKPQFRDERGFDPAAMKGTDHAAL